MGTRVPLLFACCLVVGLITDAAGVPEFLGPSSRIAYIDENSPAGTSVLMVHAMDDDGGDFTFSLTPAGQFSIDAASGEIVVAASPNPPLDRETTESISITIHLNSGGSVVASLPVTVFLNDVNDNDPIWRNQITSIASPFPEDTPVGTYIYTIVVSDADIGSNGNIQFRIQSPSDGTFTVNAVSGVVRLGRPLDYSDANTIGITIIAEDEGVPIRFTRISFTISVSAVLSTPVFTQTHYSVDLVEGNYTTTNHNNLITVVAVADNTDANIVYSQVMRGVPSDSLFTVTSTGIVNVVGNIDREAERTYDVQIEAYATSSGVANSNSDMTLVTVTVLDINDNDPVFENPHPDPIILMETTPISTVVYTFYATDADEGTNGDITYEIISPSNGPFSIGATSGVIHLTNTLNRSVTPMYALTVQVQDGGSIARRSSTTSLTIIVDSAVDGPPTFTENVYTFEIAEGSHTNEEVGAVRVVDAESPSTGIIRYEKIMRGDSVDTLFSVSPSSGRITANGLIDRETTAIYAINIRGFRVASTGSTVPQSEAAVVSVIIVVLDVNDNSPVWTSAFNPVSVIESQPTGTDIFTATATDADSGSNGHITYSFVMPPSNFPFSIDASSGVIRLLNVLDFDMQSSYTLNIQAQDGGNPPRSISDMLTVTVEDTLDPAPTFTESVYSIAILEREYSNEVIGSVRAVESIRPTAVIRYEKVSGDAIFTVTSSGTNSGAITLSGTVDAEAIQTYTVTIRAFRVTTGTTPRSDISTVSVVITIEDINDNDPVWTDSTPGPVQLLETRPIGTDVYVVTATDADSGTNGQITYSLPPPVNGPFSIGVSNGIIRLTGPIDFAVQSQYTLQIRAQDGTVPPRSITATLTVNIVDVIDPPPTFTESIYTEEIVEDVYTDQLIGTVRAIDPLNPRGAIIRYQKKSTSNSLFTVTPTGNNAGQVTVTGTLDREQTSTYSISIEAFRVANNTSTTPLSEVSVVSMLITVTDANDNSPIFLNPASTPILLSETRGVGTTIYTFHAIDMDSGSNGQVTFSLESQVDVPFIVDSGGVVRIRNALDYDVEQSYTLTIRATDGGSPPRITDTTLTINLVDVLDPPPTFALRAYSVEVSEGNYTNHLLGTVEATDTLHPTTAIIRYEQVPKGDITDSLFRVVSNGSAAGQVFLSGSVSQSVGSYSITIRAFRVISTDISPRSGISHVSMTIAITDINDNSPVFLNPRSTPISIIETRAVGSVVYTYHVTDSDTGSNGAITYSIAPSNSPFGIGSNSGVVRLIRRLNFNVAESYSLTITAQDGGATALSATTVLNIVVVDVTDPPPVFTSSEYTFSVPEGQANVAVGRVAATDSASSTAIIRYQQVMKGDTTDALFRVAETGPTAGEIRINSAADRETIPSYSISIRAFQTSNVTDTTPISGISVVSITILISDINDNSPVILNAQTTFPPIFETRIVGSNLYTIIATDADEGVNAAITYSLTAPVDGPFSIGLTTGIIRLTNSLDFDVAPSYTITVRAQDGGSPPRAATTTYIVNITDVLDPPPTFSESIYNAVLSEGTYSDHLLLTVRAIDPLHSTAIIRYEQVTQNGLFSVESSGENAGEVRVTGMLDREEDITHTVNIRAFRVASAASSTARSAIGIVSVILTVSDSNDNSPTWLNPINQPISILETEPIGTVVYSLIVTDLDEGLNGRLIFSVPSTSPFAVTQGGMVTLKEMLTSSVPSHILIVTVSDQGTPSLSSNFQLTVQVVARASTPPVFSRLVYTFSSLEGDYTTNPLRVTNVTAVPGTAEYSIKYSLQNRSDNSHTPFIVNGSSGAVDFSGILDRETQTTWIIVILAREVDPVTFEATETSPAHATVILTVVDVNDNPPTFISDHLLGSISESARPGDVAVAGVRAFDRDEGSNAVFRYSFPSGEAALPFVINSVTGVITVNQSLDYETTMDYQFSIVVQEVSTPQRLSSTAVVNVMVVNENDGAPSFPEDVYVFQIAENLPPQQLTTTTPTGLTTVTATDTDDGIFGDLTYTLLGFGVPNRFSATGSGAIISTTAMLDYEERSVYHLTLIARDGAGTLATPNQAATQITILVLDVNDHTPQCFPSSTEFTLEENIPYPNFFSISGSDGDPPNTANSNLTYSLTFANGTSSAPLFSIHSITGQISANALDYEAVPTHNYHLTVTVSDAGSPLPLSSTCAVTINIRDSNDAAPRFSEAVYRGNITENYPVGNPVGVTVLATDPEPEHSVTYFAEASDPNSAFFSVGRTDGVISLAQDVDYDPPANHREFTFRVLAIDDATPPLTGTATVIINILPQNDNFPIITNPPARDPFNYTLIEDDGEVRPLSLLTVEASDLDGDPLTYTFTTTNTFLSLDSTGTVTLISALNREAQSSHTVGIEVCDPDTRCRNVTIYIMVLDYNDQAPAFTPSSLNPTVSIQECDVMDQMVLATVTAIDTIDLGAHSAVTYSAVGGDISRFTVEETSGVIRLRASPTTTWDFETDLHNYSFTVRGTDFPGGTPRLQTPVDAVLSLTLTDCNDFAPVFNMPSYTFNVDEAVVGPSTNNTLFTGISVTDGDATSVNRMMTFSVVGAPNSTNGWFGINPDTGSIHVISGAVVDRESPSITIDSMGRGVLSFSVMVINAAPTGTFNSTATVTVTINDINDHDPVIQQTNPITVSIAEHSDVGTLVAVISAVDTIDYGVNTRVVYEIISGNENSKFVINNETGVITVAGDLDHEERTQYVVRVQAREHLGVPASNPDTIDVDITVTGTNDFSPEFDRSIYRRSFPEFNSASGTTPITPGTTVTVVHATDRDGVGSPAGQLEYRVATGAVQFGVEMFSIPDPTNGTVIILRPDLLDYETQQQFIVTIEVHDLVLPVNERRQNTTQLIVNVIDVNDIVPTFLDSAYTGSIAENQPVGSQVAVTPTIRGQDGDSMDQLTFSILPGQLFEISSDGRIVTTTTVLDRESLVLMSYRLVATVQVTDLVGHISTATLTVTVTDVNDNPPCFPPSINTVFSVEQGREIFPDPRSFIGRVQAMDLDVPSNPLITYFISGGDNGNFDIDPQTGEIYVIDQLNAGDIPFYVLNITTTDGNLTCGIQVEVTVLERNDNDPVFSQDPYLGSVVENADIGTTVDMNFTTTGVNLQVVATDLDQDAVLTFNVVPRPNSSVPFTVHPESGFIVTTAPLDRERTDTYTFVVRANDGMRSSSALIQIVVLDFNDQDPVFITDALNITIPEYFPANSVVLFVEATDNDIGSNAEILYSVSAVNPSSAAGMFNVTESEGSVFTTERVVLDPGDSQMITLTITASNLRSSLPNNLQIPRDIITVTINIEPQNMNAPNFTSPHYMFNVTENQNGTIIGSVLATVPSGNSITYSIAGIRGSDFSNFRILQDGSIINIRPFDREREDLYQFAVIAVNNGQFGHTIVSVRILDDNDNGPAFRFDPYPYTVSEAFIPNTTLLNVFASDQDIGSNAELTYSIVEGNTSVFAINPLSGEIQILLELDREETAFYSVTVSAEDSGVPPQSTTVALLVTVGDVNDNDPFFTGGAVLDNTSVEIYENTPPPLNFTMIQADDLDIQGNAIVVYSFENFTTSNGPFQIDTMTGLVTLRSGPAGNLDRERQDLYEVTVVASDQRGIGPQVRSVFGSFSVQILDQNDNLPIFTTPLYNFEVREDSPVGTTIGQVSGTDADIGSNAILFYHLTTDGPANTTCAGAFCIDHETGVLSLLEMLDTETQPMHTVSLAISNFRELEYNSSTSEFINVNTATVRVEALDTNDQAPVFMRSSLFAAVEEEAEFGTTVAQLRATDVDTENGSVVWFQIETPDAPFVVDRDTGEVTTAGVLRGLSGTTIQVQVRAFDNFGIEPTQSTVDTLSVLVYRCGEQLELSFQTQRELIENNLDRITSILAELTEARILITEVSVRQTPAGSVDTTGTDVKFFALDPDQRMVLDPNAIIRVIDENFGAVRGLFQEFKIIHVVIESCDVEVPEGLVESFPPWVWVILAILLLALCCICCCCLLVCIGEKRKSRKWKSKAHTADQLSQMDQFSHHQLTDMSINPMWADPYPYEYGSTTDMSGKSATERDNPLYESQELTIEMFQETAGSSDEEDEPDRGEQMYESQEILLEMFSDNMSEGNSSTQIIKAPEKDQSSPLNQDVEDMLEKALDESDDYDSTTSFI